MDDRSEILRHLELARRWDGPMLQLSADLHILEGVPALDLVRGWDDKQKRYFLKKLREIEGKLSAWAAVLEEEVY